VNPKSWLVRKMPFNNSKIWTLRRQIQKEEWIIQDSSNGWKQRKPTMKSCRCLTKSGNEPDVGSQLLSKPRSGQRKTWWCWWRLLPCQWLSRLSKFHFGLSRESMTAGPSCSCICNFINHWLEAPAERILKVWPLVTTSQTLCKGRSWEGIPIAVS
jgi:hypothetical protein